MKDNSITADDLQLVSGHKLLLEVSTQGEKVTDWAKRVQPEIQALLDANGALLIRGLKFIGSKQFGSVLSTLFGDDLLQYSYRSTPRTELRGNVYTATEYHSDQVIAQHNENAYSNKWARKLGFLCMLPPEQGGATPISDSRLIYQQIPQAIREEFESKGVMYVRNYSDVDLPWSEVFQTTEKSEVEAYCNANNMSFEWLSDNRLRTRQINAAVQLHPLTQEKVWFNQAHLFHYSNLEKESADTLLRVLGEENLPRNAYFGDGSAIDPGVLQLIRDLYEETKFSFQWQKNDLLLVDNMAYTHGRETFSGARKILVGMACSHEAEVFEPSKD